MMKDNIIFSKIWEDDDMIQLSVFCSSPTISVISKIYVQDSSIDKLINQIGQFLDENSDDGLWINGKKGNFTLPCLSLRFIKKDNLGHIFVEVFAEIDDGSDYTKHNCCFYVSTENGLLYNFKEKLARLKNCSLGYEISLND